MTGTEIVLDILDYMMKEKVVNFNTLKNHFGVNQSTLSRHLKLLCEKEFLVKNPEGQYCLGEKFGSFKGDSRSDHFYSIIDSAILDLSERNNVTTLYYDFSFGKMTCKLKHVVENGVSMQRVGAVRFNYIYNPWGVIFLGANQEQITKLIKNNVSFSVTKQAEPFTEEEIKSKINVLKRDGYVDDDGKIFKHLRRIAVPIEDVTGDIKGAIVSGFIDGSVDETDVEAIIGNMKNKASEVRQMI